MPAFRIRTIALLLFVVFCSAAGNSYSVLTHEEIVDLLWRQKIQPLLLKRFPDATEEDLRKAHAYAYGGCVLQDMGYYPFGNKYFSDLVHYVRSGDFVTAQLRCRIESRVPGEPGGNRLQIRPYGVCGRRRIAT